MKIKTIVFFLTFFFILQSGPGEAFVPQTPHLLYLVLEKIKKTKGLEAVQFKTVYDSDVPDEERVSIQEKITFLFPDKFRSETLSGAVPGFSVEHGSSFIKVSRGQTISRDKSPIDLYTDVLLLRNYEDLEKRLIKNGINTAEVSFDRYQDTICYVIGGPKPEDYQPFASLWIEKDTLFPVRYVVERNGWLVQCLYSRWEKISKTWYPMHVTVFVDDQLFASIDVTDITLEPDTEDTLFDIAQIIRMYPENNSDLINEEARQVQELEKHIEEFKKLYE